MAYIVLEPGDTVIYNGNDHEIYPQYYPKKGTEGQVQRGSWNDLDFAQVWWARGSTSDDDVWLVPMKDLLVKGDIEIRKVEAR